MGVRTWWSRSPTAHRLKLAVVFLAVDAMLVVLVVAGWQAVQAQRIRHGADTVRVTATVTDTVRQCGKASCRWVSVGRYQIGGRVEQDVVVVDGSHREVRDPQVVLVDPAHPRRAVNVHDHGVLWIVLGALAVAGLVAANAFGIRLMRRPWQPRRATSPAEREYPLVGPPTPGPRVRRRG